MDDKRISELFDYWLRELTEGDGSDQNRLYLIADTIRALSQFALLLRVAAEERAELDELRAGRPPVFVVDWLSLDSLARLKAKVDNEAASAKEYAVGHVWWDKAAVAAALGELIDRRRAEGR